MWHDICFPLLLNSLPDLHWDSSAIPQWKSCEENLGQQLIQHLGHESWPFLQKEEYKNHYLQPYTENKKNREGLFTCTGISPQGDIQTDTLLIQVLLCFKWKNKLYLIISRSFMWLFQQEGNWFSQAGKQLQFTWHSWDRLVVLRSSNFQWLALKCNIFKTLLNNARQTYLTHIAETLNCLSTPTTQVKIIDLFCYVMLCLK